MPIDAGNNTKLTNYRYCILEGATLFFKFYFICALQLWTVIRTYHD